MNLVSTSLKNSIQVIVRFAISVLNIKIVAVLVGPSGMALVSQLNNVLQVGLSFSNLGIKDGIVKYIAQHKDDKGTQNKYISTSIIAVLFTSILIGIIAFIFSKNLSEHYLKTDEYYLIFRFASIFLVASSLLNLLLSILNGLEQQKYFIITNIVLSVSGFLVALSAVLVWGLDGLLWAQLFLTFFAFLFGIIIYKRVVKINSYTFSTEVLKKLSKYSAMGLFSAVVGPMIYIAIRNIIIIESSIEMAGLWDGINKISNSYILIITSAFSYYFIPTFSQLERKQDIVNEVKKAYQLLIPLLLFGALVIFFGKDLIIKILFTKEFEDMRPFFIWQVIGDFFKVLSWILAILLIAKARIKTYITIELIAMGLQVLLVKLITTHLDHSYLTLYYSVENILYFLALVFVFYLYYFKGRKLAVPPKAT